MRHTIKIEAFYAKIHNQMRTIASMSPKELNNTVISRLRSKKFFQYREIDLKISCLL